MVDIDLRNILMNVRLSLKGQTYQVITGDSLP